MNDLNAALLELGFEYSDFEKWDEPTKAFTVAWENRDWSEAIRLHKEYDVGSQIEADLAQRYLDREESK